MRLPICKRTIRSWTIGTLQSQCFRFVRLVEGISDRMMRWHKRKGPGSFLPGVLLERVVRRSGSEVTLNANVERHGVLVFGGPTQDRLWRTGREGGEAREVLVQMGEPWVVGVSGFDPGSLSRDHTNLGDVEVR